MDDKKKLIECSALDIPILNTLLQGEDIDFSVVEATGDFQGSEEYLIYVSKKDFDRANLVIRNHNSSIQEKFEGLLFQSDRGLDKIRKNSFMILIILIIGYELYLFFKYNWAIFDESLVSVLFNFLVLSGLFYIHRTVKPLFGVVDIWEDKVICFQNDIKTEVQWTDIESIHLSYFLFPCHIIKYKSNRPPTIFSIEGYGFSGRYPLFRNSPLTRYWKKKNM